MNTDWLKSSFAASLKPVLDSRLATVGCLLVAVAAKSIVSWIYLDLETDKSVFLLFARSFLDAGVFAEPVRDAGSGHFLYVYNPAIASPLYSLVAVPLLFLTRSYAGTDFLISILGWTLLFSALVKLGFLLFGRRWLVVNLFLLTVAFYLFPHEMESPPKDTLAAAFTLWTILLTNDFLQKPPRPLRTLLLAFCAAAVFLVKLTYIPAAAVSVLLLFLFVVLKQSRKHTVHFVAFSALLLAIGLAVYFFVYLPASRLSNTAMDKLGRDGVPLVRGFHPENLLYTFPFISSSLVNINFWGVQIEQKAHVSFVKVMNVFKLLDAAALVFLTGSFFFFARRIFANRLWVFLVVIPVTLVVSLFFMSTTFALTHPDRYALNWWTYVAEARFYFVPMLLLQALLFRFVFLTEKFSLVRKLVLFLLFFEAAHGLYFGAKQTLSLAAVKSSLQNKSPVKKAAALAQQMANEGTNFGLLTTDNFLRRYTELGNIKTYAVSKTPVDLSWAEKGSRFLVVSHPQDTAVQKGIAGLQPNKTDTVLPFVFQYYERK